VLFDDHYPPGERLPRRLRAEFSSFSGPFGPVVCMDVNNLRVGDPLTDRGWTETGYRWHDALHLAYVVCLGWSPTFRALAGLRRRSQPRTDHIEDGGRAVVADEAIAWATFCYARTHDWTRQPAADLLDRVEEMTFGLEVSARTRSDWAHAIATGLDCMLSLWRFDGGTLTGDLDTATLEFHPPAVAAS
jgi:hypothetical protein